MDEAAAAAPAFFQNTQRMLDLAQPDMRTIRTQTSSGNHSNLLWWASVMRHREAKSLHQHERVYLVASDLRLALKSRRASGNNKWRQNRCRQRTDTFLHEKDINTLHEKHWAVEINGRYYELVRGATASAFSSRNPVDRCDRQISARIFLGTTHCSHNALKEIGRAVIETQSRYELTRGNCHRFVRVFMALALCPNHVADTIPSLPFDVEERIASSGLNRIDGCQGFSGTITNPEDGIFRRLIAAATKESDLHRASRLVGEGAEWSMSREHFGSELSLTVRRLTQKSSSDGDSTTYYNEFYANQEQTSYFLEHDGFPFSQCRTIDRSPYLSVIRYDKATKYHIVSQPDQYHYWPEGYASGMVAGPYGVTLSHGSFMQLSPTELIRDNRGIWRDGNGDRLEQPRSNVRRMFAELHDFLFPKNRANYSYQLPKIKLLGLAARKSTAKAEKHPFAVLGVLGLSVMAVPQIKRIVDARSRRDTSPSRRRGRSRGRHGGYSSDTDSDTSVASRSPSRDGYYLQ